MRTSCAVDFTASVRITETNAQSTVRIEELILDGFKSYRKRQATYKGAVRTNVCNAAVRTSISGWTSLSTLCESATARDLDRLEG